ncbi:MAG: hypothetical protein LBU67_05235 [Oscillospiraceae bacterium]|jgi:uncharacterized membrane protein YcgQ (UPF0703/DUF1980 family)|nr:hypothetical protein [Oscillospiraceae bacterium]
MKRISILLILCLIFALAGCQASASESQAEDGSNTPMADGQDTAGTSQPTAAPVLGPPKPPMDSDTVEITESLFIAQLNDVYLNQDDYLGKKIRYEGMFTQYSWTETNMTYYLVYRNSPGCCGADGQAGFEVVWPKGSDKTYPTENDWCEVTGTLETYDENGQSYLHIVLDSLTVKGERGAAFVSQ